MSGNELNVWCERCWETIALPRINDFAVGVVTIKMIEAVTERQEYKEFSKFTSDHQSALINFLDRRNAACCFLGADKVKAIINSFPLRGEGGNT